MWGKEGEETRAVPRIEREGMRALRNPLSPLGHVAIFGLGEVHVEVGKDATKV